MAKKAEEQVYGASRARLFDACLRAVAQLGYTVLHSDRAATSISFNTGRSKWSWAGQDLSATAVSQTAGRSLLIVGGSIAKGGNPIGGGSQVGAWGEKGRLTRKFFETVAAVLPKVPEPQADTSSASRAGSVSAEIAELAQLHRQGALTDDEFASAKARLLS